MELYQYCLNSNCKCAMPGVAIYKCNNCGEICCGKCHPEDMVCKCSWEEEVGDDDYVTCYGRFFYDGKIASRSEWVEKGGRLEREKREQGRRKLYEQKLKEYPAEFIAICNFGRVVSGKIFFDDLSYEGRKILLRNVEEIILSLPSSFAFEPSDKYGEGYISLRNGDRLPVKSYREYIYKKGWSNRLFNFDGHVIFYDLDLSVTKGNIEIKEGKVDINVRDIIVFRRYVPGIKVLCPEN